jgi:hypothetical protein
MSGFSRRVWIVISVCLLTVSAFGQKGKPVILKGQVVDSKAKSVVGAEVVAFEKCRDYYRSVDYAKMLTSVQRTDNGGRFLLNVTPTSQYDTYVVVRKEGFALGWDALSYNHDYKAQGKFYIILEKPKELAGKVVDAEGAPVAGATVWALPKTSYLHRLRQRPIYGPQEWLTVKTGGNGTFAFRNLPDDASADFWVKVAGRDLVYHYTTHLMNSMGFDVGREDLELVLPRGATIQGKVLEKVSRGGVSGVRLLLQLQDPRDEQQQRYKHYELVSGPDGAFSISGVPAGKHILRAVTPMDRTSEWIARSVNVNLSGNEDLKNVTVEVEKGAMLQVIARDRRTGRLLNGIKIYVHNKGATRFKGDFGFFRNAFTGADGIAHIRVPPGQCSVSAWSSSEYSGLSQGVQAVAVKNRTSRVEILLEPKLKIRGSVVDISRRPVKKAVVSIYPFGHTVFTDDNGRFEGKPNSQHPTKLLGVRDTERNLAGLTEVRYQSSTARLELKPALSITGLITDANNIGIPAARVRLILNVAYCSCFVDEVIADSTGRYRIDAVYHEREGFEYRLHVMAAGYGPVEHKRISVKGNPGELVNASPIKLVRADASISGVVVDKNGNPAANIPLFLHGYMNFDQPERSTATDSQGRFVIDRICKGPLKIQADFASSPSGSGNLYAQGGDTDVRIVIGQELTHTGHTSLVGKSLPELSEFEIRPIIEKTDGAKMLVCFFHFGQRPSRHCVRQLNLKARQLRKQGVYIVCIQASNLPDKGINDWRRDDRISLPIGMVGKEEIKTRQEWGVPSLPWLILTDSNHIVTAEGFRLNDLDERIKETENAK